MTYNDTVSCCALNKIFGFKPRIALSLMEELGGASEIFRLSKHQSETILGPFSPYRDKISEQNYKEAEKEIESLYRCGIYFIPYCSELYPKALKECPDPPLGLYVKSCSSPENVFHNKRCISIVGTRDISLYGKEWCQKTVKALHRTGSHPSIVSGLAIGTDITAHKQALDLGLPTIAVMATGIDKVYPAMHYNTARHISETPECALVTDFPPGTAPLKINFLRRNRIIAGLSDTTILIESKSKGGGMITAKLAFSYSRDVYALPGRADDIKSEGCNILIREKTAEAIVSERDLIKSMGLEYSEANERNPEGLLAEKYNDSAIKMKELCEILRLIRKRRGIDIDEISTQTGISYRTVQENAAILEADGFISIDLMQRCCIRTK